MLLLLFIVVITTATLQFSKILAHSVFFLSIAHDNNHQALSFYGDVLYKTTSFFINCLFVKHFTMKVIVNFGEKKVVVPCGLNGDISIRELIHSATTKYSKLSYNSGPILNSDQVHLRLNNGAVVDSDDRVCDVVDDREELFAIIDSHQSTYPLYTPPTMNSNGELSSSVTSSNLSSSLSEHDRLMIPSSTNRHEVIVTDADLQNRFLRVKNDTNYSSQQSISHQSSSSTNKMTYRQTNSPPTQDAIKKSFSDDSVEMHNVYIDDKTGDKVFSIILPKENSPLGIHVIPYNGDEEQVNGLVLQNIEADGRVKRHGILQINDRIVEINRINIERCSFDKAQLIFRTALLEPELELQIVRTTKKSSNPSSFRATDKPRTTLSEINQNNDLSSTDHGPNMNSLNTRRLGKIIKITLVKGNDGLGFKLASRDNPTGVANPIYVKTIFPKGAAIEDGSLQRGDRLLSVNSIDVTQMSLQETVGLLRETRVGDTVELRVSRQCDGSGTTDSGNDGTSVMDRTTNEIKPQIMTFDIPLNDTSSAGLGITLKGKTSIVDGQSVDLGIFVKSILTGGAASRDNRLRSNDQILIINDSSLINISNSDAATILHESVRREIHPGYIKVTISRLPKTSDNDQERLNSSRHVKEVDLVLPVFQSAVSFKDDENELDLTTYVPPSISRKPLVQQLSNQDHQSSSPRSLSSSSGNKQSLNQYENDLQTPDDVDSNRTNPFERETLFRQSVSEKRRLTHQPNKQVIQWKQRSFHEGRTQAERKQPIPPLPKSASNRNRASPGLIRSSSLESIPKILDERESSNATTIHDGEQKRQAKLRSRACNDSFRQAVDKSYGHNSNLNDEDSTNADTLNKVEKQRFRFSNLFANKSKRKEQSEENRTFKPIPLHYQLAPHDSRPTFHPPPPPAPFSSRKDSASSSSSSSARRSSKKKNDRPSGIFSYSLSSNDNPQQPQGYQPYRFDTSTQTPSISKPKSEHFTSTRHESHGIHDYQPKTTLAQSSLSMTNQKSSHPPIPRQFIHTNMNGSQSLKNHQPTSYPSILPTPTRSPYPSTFTVQSSHFTSYSHNMDHSMGPSQQQQPKRMGYASAPIYPPSRNYFHLENPANV
ncbi:unnamed protein product [Adineta ricciae]|uniref:PDZ domain-containing protein n=1 Tax=Adineta ricciae TaxID=249248 RepID=A0A814GKS1_ADIRI|nr:unnamed protein product [Adineta ricciae]